MKTEQSYFEQMTEEVEQACKTMGTDELRYNIANCSNLLNSDGLDDYDRIQIEKEQAIYQHHLNSKLGIFPGSGHGIQKPN